MKRNFIALIAGTVASTSAFADGNVTVLGALNTSINLQQATTSVTPTSDYPGRWRIACNSCAFFIKGEEDLGDGMKAFLQVGSVISFNQTLMATGGGITPYPLKNLLGFANTGLGLSGDFGKVTIGNWDTPYKNLAAALEPTYGTGTGYMSALIDFVGYSTATSFISSSTFSPLGGNSNDFSFSRRQEQSILYTSPKFMNVTANVMFSPNTARTASMAAIGQNPDLISAALQYADGPIMAGVSYEQHDDARTNATDTFGAGFNTTAASYGGTKDTGMKFMAGYKLTENTLIGGVYSSLKYANKVLGATADDSVSKSAWLVSAQHSMDKWRFAGAFANAGDWTCTLASGSPCAGSITDMGAQHVAAKVAYAYSKRTEAFLSWAKIWNKNAAYNFAMFEDQMNSPTMGQGTDYDAFGIGVRHVF